MEEEGEKDNELKKKKLKKIYLNVSKLNKGKYILNIINNKKIIKVTDFNKG